MIGLENNSLKARFETTEQQLQAKDAMQQALNPDAANPAYVVALNLIPRTPTWLSGLNAAPMYLGLDLRGGVHFMLQVDMQSALTKNWTLWAATCAALCAKKTCATTAFRGKKKPS